MTARAAAMLAHEAGLCVVPPLEDGSKRPDGTWKQYQARRPSEARVQEWYANGRTGVGVICGAVSGGLEMLELEGRAVAEGLPDQLRELARAAGLDETLSRILAGYLELTPSGGFHLLYRVPTPRGNTKLARRPATAEELAGNPTDKVKVLIETRGEGGYVVTAPSNGHVHPTGGAWRLVAGGFDTIATITDTERDELFRLAEMLDQLPAEPLGVPAVTTDDGERPGDIYNASPDVQERTLKLLTAHGWTDVFHNGEVVYLRRPGKDRGISATLGHVAPGVLYVFSTSTEFEAPRAHDPFGVFAKLEHGGDFAAAAKALWPGIVDAGASERQAPSAAPIAEPSDVELSVWPDPPLQAAYHGVLGDIALAVAPHTEADPVGVLGTVLAMFGAACGGNRTLYQGSQQRTNLSTVLVGATGFGGRKGTALDQGRAIFRLAYPDLANLWLVGVASGEAITGHLGRHDGQEGRPLEDRVLIVEPEFGRLLTIMNREGSTLSAVLRNAWDGVPLGHARARDESLVTRHHVTMIGHITPVGLRSKLTDTDAANGFANRLLFLAVRRSRLIPFPTAPDELVRDFVEPLHRAIVESHLPGEMSFDEAARDRWEDFYAELAITPRLGLAGAVTGRHEAQVARLALIYALADRSAVVGAVHLEAAIALADYARRSATWALGDSTGNRHADVLRRMLVDGDLSWKDAKLALGLRTAADMADAVAILVDAGLAETVSVAQSGGGRARRVIRPKGAKGAKDARGTRTEERGITT